MENVLGPLGNGFPPTAATHLVMVAGGIGYTPFVAVAKEATGRQRFGSPERSFPRTEKVTLCYGARSAEYLAGLDVGVQTRVENHARPALDSPGADACAGQLVVGGEVLSGHDPGLSV